MTEIPELFKDECLNKLRDQIKELERLTLYDYKDKLRDLLDRAVRRLVENLMKLIAEEGKRKIHELFADFFQALEEILLLMNKFVEGMEERLEDAKKHAWEDYAKVKEWWEVECGKFGRDMERVLGALEGIIRSGDDPKAYKRVALVPTDYKLAVEPYSTGTIIKCIQLTEHEAKEALKWALSPLQPVSLLLVGQNADTRILFYKNLPPEVNPWIEIDAPPAYKKEKPVEFPLRLPFSTNIPITFCRGVATKVFNPFQDRVQENRTMPIALQFLFSDKLYDDTNWIWFFLDKLDEKDEETKRYGFGWYLQGRFFRNRSFKFSIENRLFIDAVHLDFTAKDSKGRSFATIRSYEPNYTNNVFLDVEIDKKQFEITAESRWNPEGIVGRNIEVSASVNAKIQEILGGEIGVTVKAKLPTPLTTTIRKVGDQMIKNEVIDSAEAMVKSLENAYNNLVEACHARCPNLTYSLSQHKFFPCRGVGEPIGYTFIGNKKVREYQCGTCGKHFLATDSDHWDQLVSGVDAAGNFAVAIAHCACVQAKTGWAMLEILAPQVVNPKTKLAVQLYIKGKVGLQSGGEGVGPKGDIKVKIIEVSAPVEMLNSKDDYKALAELTMGILVHVALQIYEEMKPDGYSIIDFTLITTRLIDLACNPSNFLRYFLKAIPLALKDLNNQAWAEKAYEKVTLSAGIDFSLGAKAEVAIKLSGSVKPIDVGFECNLGAFCEGAKGKVDNEYKFSCGNSFEVKGGVSIPNPWAITAGLDVGMGFPLKIQKLRVKTKESLFYS